MSRFSKSLPLAAICVGLCSAQTPIFSPVAKTVVWQGNSRSLPIWNGGAFVTMDDPSYSVPNLFVSGDHGNSAIQLRIPGAVSIQNRGVARGNDGTIAVCGEGRDSAGQFWSYLAIFAPNAAEPTVIRTYPYNATALTIAPDGTIWTKGTYWNKRADGEFHYLKKSQDGVLRHFSRTGTVLGSAIPQSSLSMSEVLAGRDIVAASADRVGWPQGESYFEVSADGAVSRTALPALGQGESFDRLVITDSGRVMFTRSAHGANSQLYVLDRDSGAWQLAQFPAAGFEGTGYFMLGATGNTVAFWTTGTSGFTAQLVNVR